MKSPDIVKSLDQILKIIAKDIKQIKKAAVKSALLPETALTLSRHAKTLIDIQDANDNTKEKAKEKLSELPLDTLLQRYQDTTKPNSAQGVQLKKGPPDEVT